MADLERGREIFSQRVEYPLPAKAGVQDYVFYFVGASDGYGAGAREFMAGYYTKDAQRPRPNTNHIAKEVRSLEEMFATLQAEIAAGHVTQIRELVMVAHGNAAQLFFPVLNPTPGLDPVYGCVTEYSIAQLQDDIDHFPSMESARKAVAEHMLDDSWVTIRACNIGKSAKILYALYSLFGGRANVYGPIQYMFFGHCFVGPGQRVATKFGVYDHLVKQHFLPTSEHAPQRQAAIITDLLDPESYAIPIDLVSVQMIGGNPDDMMEYQTLVTELNKFRLSDTLRAKFQAKGFPLSAGAAIVRRARYSNVDAPQRSVWFILDRTVQSDGENYELVYEIRDQTSGVDVHTDTLEARARIASLVTSNASFPFQLFFDQDVDDEFKGIVVRLAGYAKTPQTANSEAKDVFDATEALLDAGHWTDGTLDLAYEINRKLTAASLEPLADPPPAIQQPAGSKGTWTVGGAQPLVIKREVSRTVDGDPAFSLTAYRALTPAARVKAEQVVIAGKGRDPDTPGTELAAYLDRFTLDELDGLLGYLRANYRPAYSFYIYQAQRAMVRKRGYRQWEVTHMGDAPLNDYDLLRPGENDDLRAVAYPFDFNENWNQVKASSSYVTPVQDDLFENEILRTKLQVDGTWICGSSVPDSPSASRADARAAQLPGNERFFASTPDKSLWEPPPPRLDGCADFRAAIEKWKELRDAGTDPEQMKETLQELETSEGESYYAKIQETLEPLHLSLELSDMLFQTHIEPYALLTEHIAKHLIKHGFEALGDAFEVAADFAEIAPVFTVPFEMWMHAAEANLEGVNNSEELGESVAIRYWVYQLIDLSDTLVPFPETVTIDVGEFEHAYTTVYGLDQKYNSHPFPYIYSREDAIRGFEFAAKQFSPVGPQIIEQADKDVSERIAALGLDACSIKALTDTGLLDLDKMRRATIKRFSYTVLTWVPKVR